MRNFVDVLVESFRTPESEGWDLEHAGAVSADGITIAGWGFNPESFREGWIGDLGEPSVVEMPTASGAALAPFCGTPAGGRIHHCPAALRATEKP